MSAFYIGFKHFLYILFKQYFLPTFNVLHALKRNHGNKSMNFNPQIIFSKKFTNLICFEPSFTLEEIISTEIEFSKFRYSCLISWKLFPARIIVNLSIREISFLQKLQICELLKATFTKISTVYLSLGALNIDTECNYNFHQSWLSN